MAIKKDIAILTAADMRPFSIVENRRLLHTLDLKYSFPSRMRFTHTVVPKHYKVCRSFHQVFSTAGDIVSGQSSQQQPENMLIFLKKEHYHIIGWAV